MPVTKYLERAREAAALADTLTGDAQATPAQSRHDPTIDPIVGRLCGVP